MEKYARLLICEQILEPDPARGDAFHYLLDTQMMVGFVVARLCVSSRTAGRERNT